MWQKIRKYLKYGAIGFAGLMLFGLVGSLMESWESIPSYTPKSFIEDVKRAEELNTTNHLPFNVYSTDTTYNYTRGGGSSRGSFSRPTLCSKGTLYQNNTSRSSVRCNKSFIKNYELASVDQNTFDHAVSSIESEGWVRADNPQEFSKKFDKIVTNGAGGLRFKNDRLDLSLGVSKKQVCIKDNLNEFFCDETKPDVAAFVSVTISADYSDF